MTLFKKRPFPAVFLAAFFVCYALSLGLYSEAHAQPQTSTSPSQEKPIEVRGDSVEYFHTEQKVVGTGHVIIEYEDVTLTADKITAYLNTKDTVAEGNVTLTQEGSVFTGNRAEYNFGSKVGNVSKMDAQIQPHYLGKAEQIEKLSDKHYRASRAISQPAAETILSTRYKPSRSISTQGRRWRSATRCL